MDKRKLKIYFQAKTDFLDDFLPKGSLWIAGLHTWELGFFKPNRKGQDK